jgi:hypothetical protein
MGLETQGPAQHEAFKQFLHELLFVLKKCPDVTIDSIDLINELLDTKNWRRILETQKYSSVVGPNRPLKEATDASNLIKAGACINGTCM